MITFYRMNKQFEEIQTWEPGCWINVVNPTEAEVEQVIETYQLPQSFVNDISDMDERPRTEIDDNWQLVILRVPRQTEEPFLPFVTAPLGLLYNGEVMLSISFFDTPIFEDFIRHKRRKGIEINTFYELFLRLMIASSVWYLKFLKQVNNQIRIAQSELERSIKNEELQKLLEIEKTLVFFVTSLKANGILLVKMKISRLGRAAMADEDIRDLYEDAETEIQQAIDLAIIYSDIQSGMMDAFASVISNNLNIIMKRLTSISIVLMIPTLVASIFGMNMRNGLENNFLGFTLVIVGSFVLSTIGVILLRKRNWL